MSSNNKGSVLGGAVLGLVGGIIAGAAAVKLLATTSSGKSTSAAPLTLHYYPGRGLMEIPRTLLAAKGIKYDDNRNGALTGDDKANLGRMPTVESASGSIGQSAAINYFVAAQADLLGDNAFEAAKCLEVQEHVKELISTFRQETSTPPTEEELDKFFNQGGDDTSGPAQNRGSRYLTWFLGRIEAGLTGKDGFAVGNRLTLADFVLYNALAEHLTEAETDKPECVWRTSSTGVLGDLFLFLFLVWWWCPREYSVLVHILSCFYFGLSLIRTRARETRVLGEVL